MGLLSNTGVIADVAAMMCVSSGITPRPGRPMYVYDMCVKFTYISHVELYLYIIYLYFIFRHKFNIC